LHPKPESLATLLGHRKNTLGVEEINLEYSLVLELNETLQHV